MGVEGSARGGAAAVWEDESQNSIEGRGHVRSRVTRDAGGD